MDNLVYDHGNISTKKLKGGIKSKPEQIRRLKKTVYVSRPKN